jgi:hypothetical protein
MTRNEVGALTIQVSSFRAYSILSRLALSDYHWFRHLKKCLAGQGLRSDQGAKSSAGLAERLSTKAYRSWSHDMTSAIIYILTMWRNGLV